MRLIRETIINPGSEMLQSMEELIVKAFDAVVSAPDSLAEKVKEVVGEEHSATANQAVYWSTQAFKVDPSILAITPEMVSVDLEGVTFAGATLKWPWVSGLERWMTSTFGGVAGADGSGTGGDGGGGADGEIRGELLTRIERTERTADTAREAAEESVQRIRRTSNSLGRQTGRALATAYRAQARADDAHRRLDRQQGAARRAVQATSTQQVANSRRPKYTEVLQDLERVRARVNALSAALG
ncbi:hypothetical protein [Streptomyces mangrovi]|uniref:hypothetical protein n=1 Tax=Streptomyces mangrovi TaxID=1206892 RepID=UPI00399D4498